MYSLLLLYICFYFCVFAITFIYLLPLSIFASSFIFLLHLLPSIDTTRPGIFDPKGKAKWDAWKSVEGKTKEDAEKEYVALVNQIGESQ